MTNQEAIKILSLFRDKYAAETGLNTEFAATEKALEAIVDFSGKWRDLPPMVVIHAIDTVLSAMNNPTDWPDDAPDWANWRAQDANGAWFWFEKKPVKLGITWKSIGGAWAFDTMQNLFWQTSLQQRPENKNQ